MASKHSDTESLASREDTPSPISGNVNLLYVGNEDDTDVRRRRHRTPSCDSAEEGIADTEIKHNSRRSAQDEHWKRILLLIIAITVHNVPEGLAVGVGFGAVGQTASATFESAR